MDNKKIIKCFSFLLLSVLLINISSALTLTDTSTWDDVVEFHETSPNSKYGYYEIADTILWIFNKKQIKTVELLENDYSILTAWNIKQIEVFEPTKLFDKTEYFGEDKKTDKSDKIKSESQLYRQWIISSEEIEYKTLCNFYSSDINGTELCNDWSYETKIQDTSHWTDWKEYNYSSVKSGLYQTKTIVTIGNQGTGIIDWIDISEGHQLKEWATWWNSTWGYKRNITNLDGNISSLYVINYTTNMRTDFGDIRFLDVGTESIELNYTLISKNNGINASFRVNNLGNTKVVMYYGNAIASTTSSGSNTYFGSNHILFMDSISGTNVIDSIGGFNGTLPNSNLGFSMGYINNGIISSSDTETNQQITHSGQFIGSASLTEYSAFGWMKMTSTTENNPYLFYMKNTGDSNPLRLAHLNIVGGQNEFNCAYRNDVGTIIQSFKTMPSITLTDWNFYGCILRGSTLETWVNGINIGNDTAPSGTVTTNQMLLISSGTTHRIDSGGGIDELVIIEDAISPQQIIALYNQTSPNFIVGAEIEEIGLNTSLLNPLDNFFSTIPQVNFSVNSSSSGFIQIDNVTLYIWNANNLSDLITNFTDLDSNTSIVTNWTNILEEGTYIWNAETCSETGNCTFASFNRTLLIHFTAPTINITSPKGLSGYFILADNETLIYNISESGENVSEHFVECWFEYNNTEVFPNSSSSFDGSTRIFQFPTGYANVTKLIAINSSFEFTNINENCSRRGNFTVRAILNGSNRDLYCLNQFTQDIFIGTVASTVITVINITSMEKRSLNCTGNSTSFEYVEDENSLCVHAIDEFGLHSENITNWDYEFLELNQSFNSPVVEASNQEFEMFAKINGSITTINFIYNNLSFPANIFNLGDGLTRIISSFQIPSFDNDTNVTNNFNVTMQSNTNILTQNQTQEVLILIIGNCTSFSNLLFNLSLFEEKLLTPLVGTIEADIEILNLDGITEISTKSTQFYNIQNTSICSNLNFSGTDNLYNLELRYYVDPLNNSNFLYVPEFYHIQKAEIDNLPMQIDLYDLNVNESTEFTIFYRDNDYIAEENVLLQLQRKYVDEGIFRVVEIPITSSQGSTVAHFDLNNYKYKITATKDGVVENIFPNPAIRCESELSGICEIFLKGLADVPQADFTSDLVNFFYTLEQTNSSVIVSYVIPSGESENVNIIMVQSSPFKDDSVICNTTLLSSAGQIECNVNETIGDSNVIVRIESNNDPKGNLKVTFQEDLNSTFLLNNYFIAIVLLMTIVMMVVSSPQLMVLASIFGLTFSGIVFLLKYETIGLAAGAISWLIIVGIIILVKLNKKAEQ